MWIVELALRRPLSVAVMALMLVLGALSFAMMNVDILPAINLPVVMMVYNYPGLSAIDMVRRIVLITERAYSTTVNGIEHIESESIEGLGLEKIYFHPGTDIGSPIAQLTATSLTVANYLPRGTEPPIILSYNAANVPVAQLNVTATRSPGSSCSTTDSTSSEFNCLPYLASLRRLRSAAYSATFRSISIRPRSMRTGSRRKT